MVNLYGISPAYLAQGTANNITNYFGLVWKPDTGTTSFHDGENKWFYAGHNNLTTTSLRGVTSGGVGSGPPLPGTPGVSNASGSISRIVDIAKLGSTARDPDFFELLKATVAAGSKAMGSMNLSSVSSETGTAAGTSHPYYYQTLVDTNLDYSIIQLGANIIDQFKVDGYSTRIVFNDGSDPVHEFRGVQNLPYLYRFNTASLKLRMENPQLSAAQYLADTVTESGTTVLKDTGVCMLMHIPTIWNPYDENAPLGYPAPDGPNLPTTVASGTNFRLIVDSVMPDVIHVHGHRHRRNWVQLF